MKKIGIFALAAFLFIGLSACEQKGEGSETTAATNTAMEKPAENPSNETAPAENAGGTSATTATPASTLAMTEIEFFEDSYNFGEIKQGEKVMHTFRFKNNGSNPLKVENVKPACGCTATDYSKDMIAPGEEGFVEIEFNSKGKNGIQKKTVTVTTNTEPRNTILSFTGEIVTE